MNRTFLIVVLVGCLALYLFWDDIMARRNKPVVKPTKENTVVKEGATQKYTASAKASDKLLINLD